MFKTFVLLALLFLSPGTWVATRPGSWQRSKSWQQWAVRCWW